LESGKGKKRAKKKTITPTQEKLEIYQEKIDKLQKETKEKRLNQAQKAKFKRLCGRYKSLILKLRPRDNPGKKSKSNLISQLDEIYKILEK
jgi:hypothetical protein